MCPPARFIVPIVPLMAIAVAHRVAASSRGLARWRWPLVTIGLALGAYMVHHPVDRLLLNKRDQPTRVWTWLAGDVDLGRYLPSLVSRDPEELKLALVWVVLLGVVLALDGQARRAMAPIASFAASVSPSRSGWRRASPPTTGSGRPGRDP